MVLMDRKLVSPQIHVLKFKSLSEAVFGDGASKDVLKVKQGHRVGP